MRRLIAIFAVLAFAVPGGATAGVVPAGPNVQVTDAGLGTIDDAVTPEIAAQGGALYAAWLDEREGDSTERPIYFARSDDGGASWGANKRANLLSYTGFTGRPAISVAPDGSIWIAWWLSKCFSISGACGGLDRTNDTRLALSTDGGQTFGEYMVYDASDADDVDGFPEIHAESDATFLLTFNPAGGGANVLVRRLSRAGPGLLDVETVPVSSGSGSGRVTDSAVPDGPRMSLAVRGDTVCAAWEDVRDTFAIYGACSTDRAQSFGANFRISGSNDFNPRLAFGPDGTLYAAYQDVSGGAVVVRRSSNNGAAWDTPNTAFALPGGLTIESFDLDVDASGMLLLTAPLIAGPSSDRQSDLFLATSIDRGLTFTLGPPLEDGQGRFTSIATQNHARTALGAGPLGQRAFTIWDDDRNTQDQIWSARTDLDGTPPSAPGNLAARAGDSSIVLSWDAASDSRGIAGYYVERAAAPGGPFGRITPLPVTATSYRDVGLDATPYFYRVYALDGTGNPGPPSNVAGATATVGVGLAGLSGTIAYESGGIALRDIGGGGVSAPRALGAGTAPAFTASGQEVLSVNVSGSSGSVVGRRLDGSGQRTLLSAGVLISDVDAASDPAVLAAVYQQNYIGAFFCQAFEPRLVTVPNGQELYGVDAALATDIALSSDKQFMAYTYRNWCNGVGQGVYNVPRLCVVNLVARTERCLDGADAQDSDFVPGRATLVFSAAFSGQRELWRADVQPDGSLANYTQLTRGPAGQPATDPQVSTDGTWVVFERDTDSGAGESPVLHVVRLDGDAVRSLGVAGTSPAWAGGGPAPEPAQLQVKVLLSLVQR